MLQMINNPRGGPHRGWGMFTAGIMLMILGIAAPAGAGEAVDYTDYSLEDLMAMDVVYGASKVMQKAKEAPSSITIVTREEIQTFGYRTLAEVLASLRGFYNTYDHNYQYIGVRGLGYPGDLSSRMLCLVDGVRVNEGSIGGILLGQGFPVDLDLVERIEVIRGPASSLYGTNAMLGIINVVTREGYPIDGVEASAGVRSFGGRSARLTGGYETLGGLDLIVSGSVGQIDGQDRYIEEFDYPEYNDGVFEDGDREKWHSLFAKATYEGLTLETMYAYRFKQNPMAPAWTIFNDNSAQTEDSHWSLSARYRRKLAGKIDFSSQVYYQEFTWDGQWPYDFDFEGNPVDWVDLYIDDFRGQRLTAAVDLSHRLARGHAIAAGAEYQNNFKMDMHAHDDNPYHEWYNFKQSPENWGVYLLGEARLHDRLILNLGVRHDEYTSFGGSTNPRLALVTEPVSGSVFKAMYGKAFQAPNGYELGDQEDFDPAGSSLTLIPEEIETYELIWEQDLGKGIGGSLTAYRYNYKELVDDEVNDPAGDPADWDNDEILSRGLELGLQGRFANGISGRASWSYNEVEDRWENPVAGDSRAPMRMGKLNLSLPLRAERTRLGFEVQYNGSRMTIRRNHTEPYTLVNLTLVDTGLVPGLQLKGSAFNLLDTRVGHPGTWGEYQDIIWQDGRSYRLYLTYTH
jgi:outer membrane receptor for ferrienterochelin and colicins